MSRHQVILENLNAKLVLFFLLSILMSTAVKATSSAFDEKLVEHIVSFHSDIDVQEKRDVIITETMPPITV